jgi:hypothetical protein
VFSAAKLLLLIGAAIVRSNIDFDVGKFIGKRFI